MLIALDYDGTFTHDPKFWVHFVSLAKIAGHEVICVTMRYRHEAIDMPCEVIYTSRKAKGPYMESLGRKPDVWIDDAPHWILQSSA